MPVKVKIPVPSEVSVATMSLCLKVRDEFGAEFFDEQRKSLVSYEGYVPDFMPGEHYGDYVILDIDLETGRITNWKKPTAEQLLAVLHKGDSE